MQRELVYNMHSPSALCKVCELLILASCFACLLFKGVCVFAIAETKQISVLNEVYKCLFYKKSTYFLLY